MNVKKYVCFANDLIKMNSPSMISLQVCGNVRQLNRLVLAYSFTQTEETSRINVKCQRV